MAPAGSKDEKNGGQKSRCTVPLKQSYLHTMIQYTVNFIGQTMQIITLTVNSECKRLSKNKIFKKL